MSEIRNFLENIDDEYLIGLTNKGILKRSYKDLESETVVISEQGEEITGSMGEITVRLKMPLTNSDCSCPSTSICKHIVMTILAVKNQGAAGGQENAQPQGENAQAENAQPQTDGGVQTGAAQPQRENAQAENAQTQTGGNAQGETAQPQQESPQPPREDAPKATTADKLAEIPLETLKKKTGAKDWKAVVEQTFRQKPSRMEEGNFVTVSGEAVTVKLSHPLDYSTCSICHDEKFCRHKAWALLSFLMEKGKLAEEELLQDQEEDAQEWDEENLADVLDDLKHFLEDVLLVGAARLSPEIPYGFERFAIRCHGCGLAELETQTRILAEQVKNYQERRVKVTAKGLLHHLTNCHDLVTRTKKLIDQGKNLSMLTGTFRTEYQDIPDKVLLGVGIREFASDAGFQGHTLYFLEEGTDELYTYTVARPTIYDQSRKDYRSQGAVPWGLPCTLTQLARARIRLTQGKASAERRLSSTSQAKADLLKNNIGREDISEALYDDFELLWKAYFSRVQKSRRASDLSEAEKLFLIAPQEIKDMHYDEIEQCLLFFLEDVQGRRLKARIAFSKQDETAIHGLEKLSENIKKKGDAVPAFLGTLYVENGELILYPIETVG